MFEYILVYTTGLMNKTIVADNIAPSAPCEQVMHNWITVKTLVEDKAAWNLPLTKAVWRVYMQRTRARKACNRVEVLVALNVGGTRLGMRSKKTVVGRTLNSGWVDLDVTTALHSVWPLHANWSETRVQTTLRCPRACRRRLPLRMVDLRAMARSERESMMEFQPALALHLRNEESWKSLMQSLELAQTRGRTKRSVDAVKELHASRCRKENYTIEFEDIPYLRDLVILPKSYDVGRCLGTCQYDRDHTGLPEDFITNHGVVMTLLKLNPAGWPGSHEPNVTCVPITYKAVQLIIQRTSAVESVVYANFSVSECGCR